MVLALVGFYEYEVSASSQLNGLLVACQLDFAGFYEFEPWILGRAYGYIKHTCAFDIRHISCDSFKFPRIMSSYSYARTDM